MRSERGITMLQHCLVWYKLTEHPITSVCCTDSQYVRIRAFMILTWFCQLCYRSAIFKRESSYNWLLSARLSYHNSVRLSVCPSVTRVDQSKTVQARITKSTPSAAGKTLVSGTVKLFDKFEGGHPERRP